MRVALRILMLVIVFVGPILMGVIVGRLLGW
jgi:hypothetical protein